MVTGLTSGTRGALIRRDNTPVKERIEHLDATKDNHPNNIILKILSKRILDERPVTIERKPRPDNLRPLTM